MQMKAYPLAGLLALFSVIAGFSALHATGRPPKQQAKPSSAHCFSAETQAAISAAVNKELAAFGGNTPVPAVGFSVHPHLVTAWND